ncbi:MAG: hypothetical protein KY445_02700 [Armatimonadetes bacterium]|nr:hypothetical protein [Armatimonadota bacterium]
MGEWTGDGYADAKRMFGERPAEFYRILGWCDAEDEAKPIQYEVASAKARADAGHKESASKFPRANRAPIEPSSDPADDAGDAFVRD